MLVKIRVSDIRIGEKLPVYFIKEGKNTGLGLLTLEKQINQFFSIIRNYYEILEFNDVFLTNHSSPWQELKLRVQRATKV